MAPTEKRARVFVTGRVQGVCFRDSTRRQARSLGLSGWVKNLDDGRVELLAEGPEADVNALIKWCHGGPPIAKVDGVEVHWESEAEGLGEFRITW